MHGWDEIRRRRRRRWRDGEMEMRWEMRLIVDDTNDWSTSNRGTHKNENILLRDKATSCGDPDPRDSLRHRTKLACRSAKTSKWISWSKEDSPDEFGSSKNSQTADRHRWSFLPKNKWCLKKKKQGPKRWLLLLPHTCFHFDRVPKIFEWSNLILRTTAVVKERNKQKETSLHKSRDSRPSIEPLVDSTGVRFRVPTSFRKAPEPWPKE